MKLLRTLLFGFLSLGFAVPATGQTTFNIEDYFILSSGSNWHYTGKYQPGSSIEDDFTWTVLAAKKDVGGGIMATRIKTTVDDPGDARENDEDFWYLDPSTGDLYFYGLHNGVADTAFPVQDVVLTDPVLFGRRGLTLGSVINDTGQGSVLIVLPLIGQQTATGTITATITYKDIIPYVVTPLGRFDNVLHVVLTLTGQATVNTPLGPQNINFPVRASEFFLKAHVGMIKQDQAADLNDAEVQAIDGGQVASAPIVIDGPRSSARHWLLFQ